MKKLLPEYFKPTEEEIKDIWQNGTIVIDANVLLNLFRYSKNSRNELINILQHYKNRLWVPYQVAFEFLENCQSVPVSLSKALSDTLKEIDTIPGELEGHLKLNQYDKYHILNPVEIRKDIKKFQEKLHEKVEKIKKEYEEVDKDAIVEQITTLLDGKVGYDFDEKTLDELFKEGERRYKEKIPPGFKDLEDKKGAPRRHLYGDFIWWKQAIDYADKNHCDLIIVTDDAKEDWWFKVENETKSPRVELIKEFHNQTSQSFHMYRTGRFMELAKKYDKVAVSDTSIKEVKSTSSMDYSRLFGRIDSSICRSAKDGLFEFQERLHSLYGVYPNDKASVLGTPYNSIVVNPMLPRSGAISALGFDSEKDHSHSYLRMDNLNDYVILPRDKTITDYSISMESLTDKEVKK